ncbi:MurR/RpiR family transcriptional regulator [Caproiciproducens sp.]
MPDDSFQKINKNYHNLTRKQREILDILLSNPEDVCYISLKDLSQRSSVSEVTILRMCKRLGFENFIELKKAFRSHTERLVKNFMETSYFSLDLPVVERGNPEMVIRQIINNARTQSAEFYDTVPTEHILKTARLILQAKTVLICGQGVSSVVSEYFYRRISPLIANAILVHPEDLDNVQANLVKLHPGDHVIAISFPRYYDTMRNIVQYAEYRGASVTSITDNPESPVVTRNSMNYLCDTATRVFYNSYSLPIELVNLIASGIVLEMGEAYDKLVSDAHEVIHFINESSSEKNS